MNAYFTNIQRQITNAIGKAEIEINIAVAWFTNEAFLDALIRKLRKGVVVNLLINDDEINNNECGIDFGLFLREGGSLYLSRPESLMHHKFVILDNAKLINGSYNWTYFAEYNNHENIIVTEDIQIISGFKSEFDKLIKHAMRPSSYKRGNSHLSLTQDSHMRKMVASDLMCKSQSYETSGSYSQAIHFARKAFELDGQNVTIRQSLSTLNKKITSANTGDFEVTSLGAIENEISVFRSLLSKATAAYRKKKYDDALKYLDRVKMQNPDIVEVYFWIAICFWRKGVITEGLANCNAALALNNEYSNVLNLRGVLHAESNQPLNALNDFTEAVRLNRSIYKAQFNKGLINKKIGKSSESKLDFEECVRIIEEHLLSHPNDEEAMSICGDCYSILNDPVKSKFYYSEANKLHLAKSQEDQDLNVLDRINAGKRR